MSAAGDREAAGAGQVRSAVAECLRPLTSSLVDVLRELVRHAYPKGVASVEFEVFPDPGSFTDLFPVRAFFMDDDNCEYFEYRDGKAVYPCPVDPGLLEVDGVMSVEAWDRLEAAHPGLDVCSVAAEAVVLWFHACWGAAGGGSLSLPAFISLHDAPYAFDLHRGRWIDLASGQPLAGGYPHLEIDE